MREPPGSYSRASHAGVKIGGVRAVANIVVEVRFATSAPLVIIARMRISVVDGQRQVHAILDTPTVDGTNLMGELVEIVARGIAEPGKEHGFGRWFVRIASEKIPGTEVTYGARIESVKNAMCANFKRDWSDAQYREFEEWRVDPIEIQKVPGSPDAALWKRIPERARTLGADISDDN